MVFQSKFRFGRRFNLPRIGKSNRHAGTSGEIGEVELLPKVSDGEHPLPFYLSPEVTLDPFPDPPWKEELEREEREKFKELCQDPKVARNFRDGFLQETLEEEILAVASLSLAQARAKKAQDKEADQFLEEDVFLPVVQRETLVCVWELLFDSGRDLPAQELKRMQKESDKLQMNPKSKDILSASLLEELWKREDLTELQQLSCERWQVLVFNYRSKLQINAFKTNVAFHLLQERMVSQVATDEVLNTGVFSMLEEDMVTLEEKEKTQMPPRKG